MCATGDGPTRSCAPFLKIMETAEGHRPFPDFLPQVSALNQGKKSAFPRPDEGLGPYRRGGD